MMPCPDLSLMQYGAKCCAQHACCGLCCATAVRLASTLSSGPSSKVSHQIVPADNVHQALWQPASSGPAAQLPSRF